MNSSTDPRIKKYLEAAAAIKQGQFHVDLSQEGTDDVARLGIALQELAQSLEQHLEEIRKLTSITARVNSGILLEDVLNYVFDSFRPMIPYDRIGCSLIEDSGKMVRAYWARSDAPHLEITKGYEVPLEGSSLQTIMADRQPRIINDLEAYLAEHPHSDSTLRIVREGMRSSLTCPLIAMDKPIGFLFFSSMKPHTYRRTHQDLFIQIANQISVIVEKSRYLQQMLTLDELKNKFLGMAAHDLRNPLSVIHGYIDLLLSDALGELSKDQKEIINEMSQASDMMLELINDLLDVTVIETGKLQLNRQPTDLVEYLRSIQASHRLLAGAKSIEIHLSLPKILPSVLLDQTRMKQVFANLISNAVKYSFPQSIILISVTVFEKEVWIAVKDHGQGIAVEEMRKLFKDFSRTSAKPTANEKSIGLGLAITRRLIEAHGGMIWADSQLGKGATFTFSLPSAVPAK